MNCSARFCCGCDYKKWDGGRRRGALDFWCHIHKAFKGAKWWRRVNCLRIDCMMQKRLLTRSHYFFVFIQSTNKWYRYQYFCDSNQLMCYAHLVYIFSSAHLECGFYFHTKASSLTLSCLHLSNIYLHGSNDSREKNRRIFSRIIFNWNSTIEFLHRNRCNYAHRYWERELMTMAKQKYKHTKILNYYCVYNQISQFQRIFSRILWIKLFLIKLLNSNAVYHILLLRDIHFLK